MLGQQPTPPEILVERVKFLRNAEAEGRFEATLKQLNESAKAARAAQTLNPPHSWGGGPREAMMEGALRQHRARGQPPPSAASAPATSP